MNSKRFKVIIRGVSEGRNLEEVKEKLAMLFKAPPERMAVVLQGKPVVVKRGLEPPTAEKYRQLIQKTGAVCDIAPDETAAGPPVPTGKTKSVPPQPMESMVCPKCDREQEKSSSCIQCGLIFDKHDNAGPSTSDQRNRYFEHSGSFGLFGIISILIFGTVASAILSLIYGYAICFIPFVYLNFLLTIFYGFAVGYSVSLGGKIGHVRNPGVVLFFGFLFGLAAEYFGWIVWIYALSGREILAVSPSALFALIVKIAGEGAWSIFGWTPLGGWLYLIWAIEGVMIVGGAAMIACYMTGATPYCEKCRRWLEEKTAIFPLEANVDPKKLKSDLEAAEYGSLLALRKNKSDTDPYYQIELHHCNACNRLFLLSLMKVDIEVDKDGKKDKSEDYVIQNLIIAGEAFKRIRLNWR